MTLESLTERICAFRDARDWMQFHNPKDLAVAIAAEAGELMQHFVWKTPQQAEQVAVAKRAAKLRHDLELEWEGVALALDLLEEVQQLRAENQMLKQRLARLVVE